MKRSEELFEIGGPLILEEPEPNEQTIAPKELYEAFITTWSGMAPEGLSQHCDTGENSLVVISAIYCVGILAFPQIVTEVPELAL